MNNTYLMFNFKTFDKDSLIEKFSREENTTNMVTPDKNNPKIQGFFDYPKKTMYGFKQIFGRVFSYGFSYKPKDLKMEIDKIKYEVISILLLISTDNDMGSNIIDIFDILKIICPFIGKCVLTMKIILKLDTGHGSEFDLTKQDFLDAENAKK